MSFIRVILYRIIKDYIIYIKQFLKYKIILTLYISYKKLYIGLNIYFKYNISFYITFLFFQDLYFIK